MALGTWWANDALPDLPALPAFSISKAQEADRQYIAKQTELPLWEIYDRWQDGNTCYLAFLDRTPVAFGWAGNVKGGVGEIGLAFTLPARNLYLWDFQTLPPWRGRGIYPLFLQAIIRAEIHQVDRFWILYKPGNETAARAISRAGFIFVAELLLTDGLVTGVQLFNQETRARAGADLLTSVLPYDITT